LHLIRLKNRIELLNMRQIL